MIQYEVILLALRRLYLERSVTLAMVRANGYSYLLLEHIADAVQDQRERYQTAHPSRPDNLSPSTA